MNLKNVLTGIVLLLIVGCRPTQPSYPIKISSTLAPKKAKFTTSEKSNWQFRDIVHDTIPGVSLEKAYDQLLQNKQSDTVIVAILDSGYDLNHEDLKDQIWTNPKEIPNNGIDDDQNGYIDDIHGWNFLGSANKTVIYENYEFVRILKKLKPRFDHLDPNEIQEKNRKKYKIYQKAIEELDKNIALLKEDYKFLQELINARKALDSYFSRTDYAIEELSQIDPKGDTLFKKHIQKRKFALHYNMGKAWEDNYRITVEIKEKYNLNLDYNGRAIIGDNPDVLGDGLYGNHDLVGDLSLESHGTNVAGIIAATRHNGIGMDGVTNMVKIMAIRTTPRGDEYDKDVANGIRYAVDNGAKIINMSFGKAFSLEQQLVHDAIIYAEKHDVLIVSSAGNESTNIDDNPYYPNDHNPDTGKEIATNFMSIGATTFLFDKYILADFSNYGKKNVDIFAPGYNIYTTAPNNTYQTESGTSISAPIVSGIAALIKSYYANLSMIEIKEILLNSGVTYNVDIAFKQENGTKKMVPFSELSKSGKVVNAYNALLLAEQVSKGKK